MGMIPIDDINKFNESCAPHIHGDDSIKYGYNLMVSV